MADNWLQDSTGRARALLIDTSVPNAARVADYLVGGRDNFEADRRAVRLLTAAAPVIGTSFAAACAFHQRAVRYLVAEAGIRQFLAIGTSATLTGNTHEVAQSLAPKCRVVYVDSDPMVLAHARALLTSTPDGVVAAVDADVTDPRAIVSGAAETLDVGRPVAILLMATLGYVLEDAAAAEILLTLAGAVPAGSHVALYHQASDLDPAMAVTTQRWNALSGQPVTLRSRAQLTALLAGLELVPPGLVPVTDWQPAPDDPRFERAVPVYAAVARKP
ncbi:SAM-dependent methyltransferase [Trebonia kvetii]|uniref:SAM-dependent methyltransferase n=1 Tax=Trebonia kvetii TaxID=2480626 RepID=A0A6P2BQ96_9ACTN|nr:SAM-dependent methyltransferase [Trebonia kvetii]TVZ01028.1 SAM-dependent methyltransferase [Trebonia kvetii]